MVFENDETKFCAIFYFSAHFFLNRSRLQGLISVLLRYVDLQAFLGRAGLETDLAMILEDIWEVFALHMVSHLSPPIG